MTTTLPDRPLPSTASYILATSILAVCVGYFLGQASSIGLFSSSSKSKQSSSSTTGKSKSSWPNSYDVTVHPDSSDEELMTHLNGGEKKKKKKKKKQQVKDSEEDESSNSSSSDNSDRNEDEEEHSPPEPQPGLKTFEENKGEECKMVLVVRTDLGMGKGKIAAQCAHATLACYKHHLSASSPSPSPSPLLHRWERTGQAKIALQVPSLSQLEELQAKALRVGLCAQVIQDAGRTQVASGSATVLGVGPGPRSVVDGVTGGLRLL
ncbi:MAG: hypothetical protein Q9161_008080 [Pseudevernia consocians]